jgi:hypothetical protein
MDLSYAAVKADGTEHANILHTGKLYAIFEIAAE